MARIGPGPDCNGRPARRGAPRKANTTAFPVGNSPTLTGKWTPRTSESTPNQDETSAALFSMILSGESPKTKGRFQDRDPEGSKNGRGNNERSFASGNLVPLSSMVLRGSRITQDMRLEAHDVQAP